MRSRTSFITRCTAASAVSPVSIASRTRRIQPPSAATMRVASSTSRGPSPAGSRVSIRSSSDCRIDRAAAASRFTSAAGSSASSRRSGAPMPCSTTGPMAMPGAIGVAENCRDMVAIRPCSAPSLAPALLSSSASSIATVSSTSHSSSA